MPEGSGERWSVVGVVLIVVATIAIMLLCASCATPAELRRMEGEWSARTDTRYVRPSEGRAVERAEKYADEIAEELTANLEALHHSARDARLDLANDQAKAFGDVHARITTNNAVVDAKLAAMKTATDAGTAKAHAQQTVFGSRLSALTTMMLRMLAESAQIGARLKTLERRTDTDRAVLDGVEKRAQQSIQELKDLGPELMGRSLDRLKIQAEGVIASAQLQGRADAQEIWMSLGQGLIALAGGVGALVAALHFLGKRKASREAWDRGEQA